MSHKMHFPQYLSDNTCVGVTAQHEGNTFKPKRGLPEVQLQSHCVGHTDVRKGFKNSCNVLPNLNRQSVAKK